MANSGSAISVDVLLENRKPSSRSSVIQPSVPNNKGCFAFGQSYLCGFGQQRPKWIIHMNKTEDVFEAWWHFHINWNENIVLALICLCETEPSAEMLPCLMCCEGSESVDQLVLRQTNIWNLDKQSGQQRAQGWGSPQRGHKGASVSAGREIPL